MEYYNENIVILDAPEVISRMFVPAIMTCNTRAITNRKGWLASTLRDLGFTITKYGRRKVNQLLVIGILI